MSQSLPSFHPAIPEFPGLISGRYVRAATTVEHMHVEPAAKLRARSRPRTSFVFARRNICMLPVRAMRLEPEEPEESENSRRSAAGAQHLPLSRRPLRTISTPRRSMPRDSERAMFVMFKSCERMRAAVVRSAAAADE